MEWYEAAGLLLACVLAMMAIGLPVAYSFLVANLVGVYVFMGGTVGIEQMVANTADSISSFLLVAVPLFVLMGNIFFHTGIGKEVFDALDSLFGRVPGRLSYATVAGGTLFAALSGSQMANTAMMGSLMIPEMQGRGYKVHLALGPVMGSGGLAVLIPPSALGVLLGSLAGLDVAALLMAGVVVMVAVGTYSVNNSMLDLAIAFIAGVAGFLLRYNGFPTAPVVIGLVLGRMVEENLRTGLIAYDGSFAAFFGRPIPIVIYAATILVLFWPVISRWRNRRRANAN